MSPLPKEPGDTIAAVPQTLETPPPPSKADMIGVGIVTGVAATAIIQTGRGILATVVKSPLVVLGLGVASGYFAHKYRKEIITLSNQAGEQSKDFVLRQKQGLQQILAKGQQSGEKPEDTAQ